MGHPMTYHEAKRMIRKSARRQTPEEMLEGMPDPVKVLVLKAGIAKATLQLMAMGEDPDKFGDIGGIPEAIAKAVRAHYDDVMRKSVERTGDAKFMKAYEETKARAEKRRQTEVTKSATETSCGGCAGCLNAGREGAQYVAKSTGRKRMTLEEGIAKAFDEHPEWYAIHKAAVTPTVPAPEQSQRDAMLNELDKEAERLYPDVPRDQRRAKYLNTDAGKRLQRRYDAAGRDVDL